MTEVEKERKKKEKEGRKETVAECREVKVMIKLKDGENKDA